MSKYLMDTIARRDVAFFSSRGPWLITKSGEEYLDFFCDVGTASLGYFGPEVLLALSALTANFVAPHSPNLFNHALRDEAARRLCQTTGMDRVFFCNSGTEAVEAAIKMARLYQYKRHDRSTAVSIWSHEGGFHGRTYGSLACGDGAPHHYEGFGPFPEGFLHFNLEDKMPPRHAGAVILAPIHGNNDVGLVDVERLRALREYCTKHGIVLIFDEVQTGSGRCGGQQFTYAQRIGVEPDAICLAKGLGMGAPVGALLAKEPFGSAFTPGTHFSTFGGNPIGMAFVLEMLDWFEQNRQAADDTGSELWCRLDELPWVKNLRGAGALIAFDVEKDARAFADACFNQRLLIGAFRNGPGPVKITPPLNIDRSLVHEGVERMKRAWESLP